MGAILRLPGIISLALAVRIKYIDDNVFYANKFTDLMISNLIKTDWALAIFTVLMLSACATSPEVAPVSDAETAQRTAQTGAADAVGTLSSSEVDSRRLADQLQEMQNKSVYFDFDEFVIKPEYHELIRQLTEFMKAHGNVIVTLEGNADERGSDEYNLALGSLRAKAVRKALGIMGIADNRIEAVSLGGENPRLTCHEESCWRENRRVDFKVRQGS